MMFTSPEVFAADMGIIDSFSEVCSRQMCVNMLDELHSINRIERGFRRGLFGFRISGQRLNALWERVEPHVRPPIELPAFVPKVEHLGERSSDVSGPVRAHETSGVVLRKLREAHQDIVSGTPVDVAARAAMFDGRDDLMNALKGAAEEHRQFRWLHEQLERMDEVEALKAENLRLKAVIAEQAITLSQQRHSSDE